MNKYYFLVLSIILLSNLSFAQTPDSFSIIDPVVDSTFVIYPSAGYMAPLYIKNKNYIIFQKNASERKILKDANVESFTFPRYNDNGLFALDKNGVYYNGDFIATDTWSGYFFWPQKIKAFLIKRCERFLFLSCICLQSPTGHLNQIHTANERQALHVVRQYLQIVHKFYRNLSCSCHHSQKAPIEDN